MSKDKAKYAVCIVALGLLSIFLANSLWTEIAGNLPNIELPEKLKRLIEPGRYETGVFSFVMLCVVIPAGEEFVFRFAFFNALKKYRGVKCSAVVSSLAFALIHGFSAAAPLAFFAGLLFCYVYEIGGVLKFTVVIHVLNNMAAYLSLFRYDLPLGTGGALVVTAAYALLVLSLALALYCLSRSLHKYVEIR